MLKTQNPFLCKGEIPTMSWLMEKNLLDQPIKMRTYDNIRKIATGQGDDNETGCKLDCPFFKKYYKMITINLVIIIDNAKETIFNFPQRIAMLL